MLRITAKIDISKGQVQSATNSIANVKRSSTVNEVIGKHRQIQKPYILGRSRLGGGQCYTKKANFYIGSIPSDNNGNFPSNYVIEINSSIVPQITIIFNKQKGEYPNSIDVDGQIVYAHSPKLVIPVTNAQTHTITISNWNTPNSPMVISSIYADISIDINDTNLIDFSRTIMSKADYKLPSFGILSNSGNVSFIDRDSELRDLLYTRLVNDSNIISIFLENTISGAKEQIGYFNTQQWVYTNSKSFVDVTLRDDLEEWQSINCPAINYIPTVSTSQTAEWLYNQLYAQTPSKYDMLLFDELDETTQEILSGTTIQYPVLDSDNLWAEWNKLCELCFLNIYKDNNGRTVCKYIGG